MDVFNLKYVLKINTRPDSVNVAGSLQCKMLALKHNYNVLCQGTRHSLPVLTLRYEAVGR